ncbi:hypothetical protein DM01DRAFT_1332394 [Hesseltinella vesiculosa]|uniref:UDP-glucose:Glyco protein glucosyltransferase n=1 Tax=Hesseltinella vesiculosa TaxID=101127 RepID=A0A1X2GUX1_9FUNG|nr:hypothetical protein DM01DRAFT_1332394 [Hesseltinella vesiculosa]
MTRCISIGLAIGLLCSWTVASQEPSPPVELTMTAPWAAPDALVEIAETLAKVAPQSYWDYVQDLTSIDQDALTPQQQYNRAMTLARHHVADPQLLSLIQLHLGLHAAAPLIEAHHQVYQHSVQPTISSFDASCPVWVQVGNTQACTVDTLLLQELDSRHVNPVQLPSDHVYGRLNRTDTQLPLLHLYTSSFSTPEFAAWYQYLRTRVDLNHDLSFTLRYKPASSAPSPLYLTGYGVELALKNTDYLVIDDRQSQTTPAVLDKDTSKDSFIKNIGKKVNQILFTDETPTIKPMTQDEIKHLSLKATQFILEAKNPLAALAQLAQDFPKYAHKISTVALQDEVIQELTKNQRQHVRAGMSQMWLNGLPVENSEANPFYFARALIREHRIIEDLVSEGLTHQQALDLVSVDVLPDETNDGATQAFDTRDDPSSPSVIWLNDIERDNLYSSWDEDLGQFLRPGYPGQLKAVRKNIFNVLFVENLASTPSLHRIVEEIGSVIQQGTPLRFGLVPVVDDHNGVASLMAKTALDLHENKGLAPTVAFLEKVLALVSANKAEAPTKEIIAEAYSSVTNSDAWTAIETQPIPSGLTHYLQRLGLDEPSEGDVLFLNGQLLEYSNEQPWSRILMNALHMQTQLLTRDIYYGNIKNEDNVYDYFLDQDNVASSRNPYIGITEQRPLTMISNNVHQDIHYVSSDGPNYANLWIVGDMDTPQGLKLALNALEFMNQDTSEHARLSLLHMPSKKDVAHDTVLFSDVLFTHMFFNKPTVDSLKQLVEAQYQHWQNNGQGLAPGSPTVDSDKQDEAIDYWHTVRTHLTLANARPVLTSPDQAAIILNGRVVGPFSASKGFTASDFNTLWQREWHDRISPMHKRLTDLSFSHCSQTAMADVMTRLMVVLQSVKANTVRNVLLTNNKQGSRDRYYHHLAGDKSRLRIGSTDKVYAEVGVLLDPLSEQAQAWSGLLLALSELEGVVLDIRFNAVQSLEKLPLTRFYRSVVDADWHFDAQGQLNVPTAYFDALPLEPLYTLGVHTIEPWQVTVKAANGVDLDNIRLTSLPAKETSVKAGYELEQILIEGHSLDSSNQQPPRGVQFHLAPVHAPAVTGTIVMANLGYLQLKAGPGLWQLSLRPGRSSDVYHLESIGTHGQWNASEAADKPLFLDSFEGLQVFPMVKKNPGMETVDVLEATDSAPQDTGILSSLSQRFFGKKDTTEQDLAATHGPKHAEINIFSVASGHLYERFLAIMTASVMKHTESTVKFWFIENFLSPAFKDFLPELAEAYGFDYELVTYKWPSWLNAQKEKQRTIWGYKILFLDVLFPLDLEKVIFVDADQIVRTDMKELVDLDLKGAPYGYTPFCSDRKEMDGFRFWTQGYWQDHLSGRPYHISALYVVDLVRFRQLAAGDRLRAQYQQLSADPNSLANLDQDLPNNMIHAVPIFSLPQEWLWCETWCSDESLAKAKTIDLCNNPLTKEPKLDRARRQVPEWETYDTEIESIRTRFLQKHVETEASTSFHDEL